MILENLHEDELDDYRKKKKKGKKKDMKWKSK